MATQDTTLDRLGLEGVLLSERKMRGYGGMREREASWCDGGAGDGQRPSCVDEDVVRGGRISDYGNGYTSSRETTWRRQGMHSSYINIKIHNICLFFETLIAPLKGTMAC